MNKKCDCKLCKQSETFYKVLERVSKEDKEYLERIYNHLMDVEADLEYTEKLYIPKLIKKLEGLEAVIEIMSTQSKGKVNEQSES